MTKIVQLAGGNAESQDQYVGPPRELTVDTSNQDLRLHDGATPGGRVIQSRANADARYQPRSPELDGLDGFEPQERGFLVRKGPSDYVLRSIQVQLNQLVISNPDGNTGNPTLGLSSFLEGEFTFSDAVTFASPIVGISGFTGVTNGQHIGNVTGDVVGDVTGNLTGDASGNHSGTFTGSVNVVGGSLLLADNQIPTSKISGLQAFVAANGVPTGTIVAWWGSLANVPSGWFLCNGANGTPDLRGRFIYGASTEPQVGTQGGGTTHTHTGTTQNGGTHTHAVTVNPTALTVNQLPAHKHKTGLALDGAQNSATALYGTVALPATHPTSIETDTGDGVNDSYTSDVGAGEGHSHTGATASHTGHTHGFTSDAGSSLPPFMLLAYIMKG